MKARKLEFFRLPLPTGFFPSGFCGGACAKPRSHRIDIRRHSRNASPHYFSIIFFIFLLSFLFSRFPRFRCPGAGGHQSHTRNDGRPHAGGVFLLLVMRPRRSRAVAALGAPCRRGGGRVIVRARACVCVCVCVRVRVWAPPFARRVRRGCQCARRRPRSARDTRTRRAERARRPSRRARRYYRQRALRPGPPGPRVAPRPVALGGRRRRDGRQPAPPAAAPAAVNSSCRGLRAAWPRRCAACWRTSATTRRPSSRCCCGRSSG